MTYLVTAENAYDERTFCRECTTWEDVELVVECAVIENYTRDAIRVWHNVPIKISIAVETV